ncbi:hypothetical protein U737_18895 [Methylomonas sp. LW13]|uniref:hypothetical protein n=1 Tax=unclassified Methylomonas TaxID=2608980 RepID=UPI00051C31FD|nr:hypothetical protein [Methylomonas sp. LW13]QBC28807.1 hypothetical protein U737_18895 [Methylomonas sp. LW13]
MVVGEVLFTTLLLFATTGLAAIGDGDKFDFLPVPGEFCNSTSDQKQRDLFKHYPDDEGIINLYAHYLGLCQLVHNGSIAEQAASVLWLEQRNSLIEKRKK